MMWFYFLSFEVLEGKGEGRREVCQLRLPHQLPGGEGGGGEGGGEEEVEVQGSDRQHTSYVYVAYFPPCRMSSLKGTKRQYSSQMNQHFQNCKKYRNTTRGMW